MKDFEEELSFFGGLKNGKWGIIIGNLEKLQYNTYTMPQGSYFINAQRKKLSYLLSTLMLVFACSGLSAIAASVGVYLLKSRENHNMQESQKECAGGEVLDSDKQDSGNDIRKDESNNKEEEKSIEVYRVDKQTQDSQDSKEVAEQSESGTVTVCENNCPTQDMPYCVSGTEVIYKTGIKVGCSEKARSAFEKYIEYLTKDPESDYKGTQFTFTEAKCEGLYNSLQYWIVTYHYKAAEGSEGYGQIYINENGEIVEFYGCE